MLEIFDNAYLKMFLFVFIFWLILALIYTQFRKQILNFLLGSYVDDVKKEEAKQNQIKNATKINTDLQKLSFGTSQTLTITKRAEYVPKITKRKHKSKKRSTRSKKSKRSTKSTRSKRSTKSTRSKRSTKSTRSKRSTKSSSKNNSITNLFNKKTKKTKTSLKNKAKSKAKNKLKDQKKQMTSPMNSNDKYRNMSAEERKKQLEKDQQMRNTKKIASLISKLSKGPAGVIILIIVIILDNVLKLDVNDFDKCPAGTYDLMSLPKYIRVIIGMVPNLGDLFDLIGNKLCFKEGCKKGTYKENGLCYKNCRSGYQPVGPVCWKRCGTDIDIGAMCRKRCRNGYKDVAGVCWGRCPGGFRDDGALCTKDLKCRTWWDGCKDRRRECCGPWYDVCKKRCWKCVGGPRTKCEGPETRAKPSYVPQTYPKQSYGRGIGQIPLDISMKPRLKK
jgi:hypothetical protein